MIALADIDKVRQVQRLAYECAETTARQLHPGITEKKAVVLMTQWLNEKGVDDCFHKPFAWFGERTAFKGFRGFKHLAGFNPAFFPTDKILTENMPFILDCAPSTNGYTADIGYSGLLGKNPLYEKMLDDLHLFRDLILSSSKKQLAIYDISSKVDLLCEELGYEARHKAYPFETLAHYVDILGDDHKNTHKTFFRFGVRNLKRLSSQGLSVFRGKPSPIWNSNRKKNLPAMPGLWAVEPHIGLGNMGAKWEELLVVTENDAYWLDDDLPHVNRWKKRKLV